MYNVDGELATLSGRSCHLLSALQSAIADVRDSERRTFGNTWIGPMSEYVHGLHTSAMSSTTRVREDLFELKLWFTTPPLHSHVPWQPWPHY